MKKNFLAGLLVILLLVGMVGVANSSPINVATSGTASQSSTGTWGSTGYASNAIDGDLTSSWNWESDVDNSISHTEKESQAWWQVQLDKVYDIEQLVLWNRGDNVQNRLNNFDIFILNSNANETEWSSLGNSTFFPSLAVDYNPAVAGDIVKIQLQGTNYLHLAEVQVFTAAPVPEPSTILLLGSGLLGLGWYGRKRKKA